MPLPPAAARHCTSNQGRPSAAGMPSAPPRSTAGQPATRTVLRRSAAVDKAAFRPVQVTAPHSTRRSRSTCRARVEGGTNRVMGGAA